jgi:hypothetical protein
MDDKYFQEFGFIAKIKLPRNPVREISEIHTKLSNEFQKIWNELIDPVRNKLASFESSPGAKIFCRKLGADYYRESYEAVSVGQFAEVA